MSILAPQIKQSANHDKGKPRQSQIPDLMATEGLRLAAYQTIRKTVLRISAVAKGFLLSQTQKVTLIKPNMPLIFQKDSVFKKVKTGDQLVR